MIFQSVVFLLIILCTVFWAWQGAFSATLMFIAALLASVLAAGLCQDFVPEFSKFRPDYAEAVMFFLIFAFGFSVLRIAGGYAAPRNIHLPRWFDIGAGALMGFFTALLAIGTLVIGVEMLPGHQKILGFDRFPNGIDKEPAKLWIAADDFVTWVWSRTSDGSLGSWSGAAYAADHPDLSQELYGDRHVVVFGSDPVVPQNRFEVEAVFVLDNPDTLKKLHLPGPPAWLPRNTYNSGDLVSYQGAAYRAVNPTVGAAPVADEKWVREPDKKVIIVRSRIIKGDDRPDVSCDVDNLYRITPAEVRLVAGPADHPAEYFPVGYMDGGTYFTPLNIDTGHLVEDYTVDKADLINDWVFVLPPDAEPRIFGEKQIASQDITGLVQAAMQAPKPVEFSAATLAAYPPLNFLKDLPSVEISVRRSFGEATNQPVAHQDVYLLRYGIIKRKIHPEINAAWDKLENMQGPAKQGTLNRYNPIKILMGEDDVVQISEFISMLLTAQETNDPREDVREGDHFINDILMPILLDPDKNLVVWKTTTDENGKTPEKHIYPGNYVVVSWSVDKDKGSFHFWAVSTNLAKKPGDDSLNLVELKDANAYVRTATP